MTTAPLPKKISVSAMQRVRNIIDSFRQDGRVADVEALEALVAAADAQSSPPYLTLQQAAKRLYITPERVLRRIENGHIEGQIVNGEMTVVASSLAQYEHLFEVFDALDEDRVPPTTQEINAVLAEDRKNWTWIGKGEL